MAEVWKFKTLNEYATALWCVDGNFTVNFTSNYQQFVGMKDIGNGDGFAYLKSDGSETYVYSTYYAIKPEYEDWDTSPYRTLIFDEAPSGELLTWLKGVAVKQKTISDTFASIQIHLREAYEELKTKSATIPTQRNIANLAGSIETISTGIDTSDATATADDILKDKTAYVNGVKITGTIEGYDGTFEDVGPASYSLTLDLMRGGTLYEGSSPSIAGTPDKVADIPFDYDNPTVYTITKPYVRIDAYSSVISASTTGGIEYVQSTDNSTTDYVRYYYITGDCTLNVQTCLTGDTLITLANGLQKRIDRLTLTDKILAYNPDTMSFEADDITYTDADCNKTFTEYDKWTFSDGTIVKTVHRHRFYNVERQAMAYMDEWNIGEHAVKQNGERIALVSHENVKEEVKHYTIFTKHQNYFANGLLSGNRYTAELHL